MKRRVHPAILVLAVLACAAVPASAQQIWMAAVSPYTQAAPKWRQWDASVDYMDLFRPDAPWSTVAGRTNVFKIGTAYALSGNEDQPPGPAVSAPSSSIRSLHISMNEPSRRKPPPNLSM